MAHPLHIANGLILDYSPSAGGVSDGILALDGSGNVTVYSSLAVNRLAAQTASRAATFDGSGFLAASSVTTTELGYVSGVTSAIQAQLDSKQSTISLTANRAVVSDGSGLLAVSAVTSTEIGYVSGVTSSIQTQLNSKQATITGGATTIVSSNLTATRALVSDGSGKVIVSAVTATELGYSAGVTSAIQTQLNTKLTVTLTSPSSGDVITYNGSSWVNSAAGSGTLPVGGSAGQYLNKVDGTNYNAQWSTLTAAKITDLTATAAEINVLHTVTTTTAQLNYLNTATSDIQTQIDNKLGKVLPQNAIWVGDGASIAAAVVAGSEGQVLTISGGIPSWQTTAGTGTVTSVNVAGGTTGLTTSGGPVTTTGTITLAGTLVAANGGTGFASYTAGDLIYASGATAFSKLGIGTNGFILTVTAGLPTWASASSVGWAVSGSTTITGSTTQTGAFNNTFHLNNVTITQNALSGSAGANAFTITGGAHTSLTLSTELSDVNFSLGRTVQFSTGALSLQRAFQIQAPTYAFTGTSTITNAATFSTYAPSAGTNATITNSHAILIGSGSLVGTVTNSYGLTVNAQTGAANNYAAQFMGGNVGIGQASPTYQLHITGNAANKNLLLIEEDGGTNILEIIEAGGVNKIAFFAATPVAQQAAVTSTQDIANVLNAYGLIPSSIIAAPTSLTISGSAPKITYTNASGTVTNYTEQIFTTSSAGSFAIDIAGGLSGIPHSSTLFIEVILVGIQSSATAGDRGLTLKNTGAFRYNGTGTLVQIGSSTNQFSQTDEGSPTATLSISSSTITYALTFAPAHTYSYTLYCKYWTGQ